MKKNLFLILISILLMPSAFAASGWGTGNSIYIKTDVNQTSATRYRLNSTTTPVFNNYVFGQANALIISHVNTGISAWVTAPAYLDATSFKFYYRVYKEGTTPTNWITVTMPNNTGGANYESDMLNINVHSLAPENGTYVLEVTLSKTEYNEDGSVASFLQFPTNDVPYDAPNPGLKATFRVGEPTLPTSVTPYVYIGGSTATRVSAGDFYNSNIGNFSDEIVLGGELIAWRNTRSAGTMWYQINNEAAQSISLPYVEIDPANGNNSRHYAETAIDISSLPTGDHTLAVWYQLENVTKDNGGINYVATFSKTTTDVEGHHTNTRISGLNGKILANFDGEANIQLFSISGQLITSKIVSNQFTYNVAKGVYIFNVNGKAHKVLVH